MAKYEELLAETEFFESCFFDGESLADNVLLYAFQRTSDSVAAHDIVRGWVETITFAYFNFEPIQFLNQLDLWYDIIYEECREVRKPDSISEAYSEQKLADSNKKLFNKFIDRMLELFPEAEAEE